MIWKVFLFKFFRHPDKMLFFSPQLQPNLYPQIFAAIKFSSERTKVLLFQEFLITPAPHRAGFLHLLHGNGTPGSNTGQKAFPAGKKIIPHYLLGQPVFPGTKGASAEFRQRSPAVIVSIHISPDHHNPSGTDTVHQYYAGHHRCGCGNRSLRKRYSKPSVVPGHTWQIPDRRTHLSASSLSAGYP